MEMDKSRLLHYLRSMTSSDWLVGSIEFNSATKQSLILSQLETSNLITATTGCLLYTVFLIELLYTKF